MSNAPFDPSVAPSSNPPGDSGSPFTPARLALRRVLIDTYHENVA